MADVILLLIIFLFEYLLFYFLPVLNGKETLFGIVLKTDDFQLHGLPLLREYRRSLTLAAIACLGAIYLFWKFLPNSLPIIYIIATFVILYPLIKYLRKTWQLRDKRTVSRLATPLKPRHLRDFSNYWLETGIILLTLAPFLMLAESYSILPEVVPIHWNAAGEADGWAKKSFLSVFGLPILAVFLQVFLIILKQDIIQARFRVPAEQAEQVLSLKEISLQANVGLIDWCRLIGGLLLGTVALLVMSPVLPENLAGMLHISNWATLVLLLAGMAFYLYRMILANREIKSLTGQITFQTATEMEGWADGLFYYNRQDPAFMVEKPGGMGFTINFAHKRAFIYLALILSPLIVLFLDLALIKK